MKLAKTFITTAVLLATTSTAALAVDDDKKFDGLYGGIEAGIDWTKLSGDLSRDKSFYYGGVLGFRRQMDTGLVMGLEGTFGDTGFQNNTANADYEWSAGLTLGSAFGSDGDNLIYGKAAYVRTRFTDVGDSGSSRNFTTKGWRFGGGYERSLSENVSFRLGGDYTAYGNDTGGWSAKSGLLVKF